jgi:hypothetical protein
MNAVMPRITIAKDNTISVIAIALFGSHKTIVPAAASPKNQ